MNNYNHDLVDILQNLQIVNNNNKKRIKQDPKYKVLVGKSTRVDERTRLKIMVIGSKESVVELQIFLNNELESPETMRVSLTMDTSLLIAESNKPSDKRDWIAILPSATFENLYINNNYLPTDDGNIKINTKEYCIISGGDVTPFSDEDDFIREVKELVTESVSNIINYNDESNNDKSEQ